MYDLLNAQDRFEESNGVINFGKPLTYTNQGNDFVNFMDPDDGSYNEVEWIGGQYYYPIRPFILQAPVQSSDPSSTLESSNASDTQNSNSTNSTAANSTSTSNSTSNLTDSDIESTHNN